jgi:cobalt/nickel transport system permease protein
MRLESRDPAENRQGFLQGLDARIKLLFTVAFVTLAVAAPIGSWRLLGGLGLVLVFLIGLSGCSLRTLLARWAGFLLLVGFLAAMLAPGLPERAVHGLPGVMLSILARNSLAFLAMLLLAAVTPWRLLIRAMHRLRVPRVLVETLLFMERYLHVLGDELARMTTARRARSFGTGYVGSWKTVTSLISVLFLRTFERALRVQSSMLARGWDGTLRTLDD